MENKNMKHSRKKNKTYIYVCTSCVLVIILFLFCIFTLSNILNRTDETEEFGINSTTDYLESQTPDIEDGTVNMQDPWNLVLVNRNNPIPKDIEINLVEVDGGEKVDERIYKPLMEMLEAAREENWGELPMVVSGYRTQDTQQSLYDEKIREYKNEGYSDAEAIKQAEQWVARPGYSEHQIGLAVDINGATYDLYFWLQENSYKYGFIFRYPGNKTDITGTAEEVWHYRYVGVEAATEMYKEGLCLEEYLEKKQSEN
jgi:D-alanyl-D-alanine carboxypeptidase